MSCLRSHFTKQCTLTDLILKYKYSSPCTVFVWQVYLAVNVKIFVFRWASFSLFLIFIMHRITFFQSSFLKNKFYICNPDLLFIRGRVCALWSVHGMSRPFQRHLFM